MSRRETGQRVRNRTVRVRSKTRQTLLVVLALVVLVALLAVIIGTPIVRSRDVAFFVDGTPIFQEYVSAMMTDLPFDISSNFYKARVELANPSDPKTQYLIAGLQREAVQRLVIMVAQSRKATDQMIIVTPSALDAAVDNYVKDHAAPGDSAEAQRLHSSVMRSYIQLRELSKAYENELTKNTTISPAEIKEYYDTWGWKYTDKAGRRLTIEEAGKKLVDDALANKKFHLILDDRAQLLKSEAHLMDGDTRYKQFMRWWNIMFGIPVPDELQPLTVDTGS